MHSSWEHLSRTVAMHEAECQHVIQKHEIASQTTSENVSLTNLQTLNPSQSSAACLAAGGVLVEAVHDNLPRPDRPQTQPG
jgi:hypothetical protein